MALKLIDRAFYHYSIDNDSAVRTWDGKKEEGYRTSLEKVRAYLETQPEPVRRAFAGYGMMQFNLLMVREIFAAGRSAADQSRTETSESTGQPFTLAGKIRKMTELSKTEPFASALKGYDPEHHKGARYLPIRFLNKGLTVGAAAIYEARVLQNAHRERMH